MSDRPHRVGLGRRMVRATRLALRGLEAVAVTGAAGLSAAAHLERIDEARHSVVLDRYRRAWASGMLHAGGAEVVLAGPPPTPARGPRIVVANHRSMLDTPVLLRLFGGHFLANHALGELPVLGHAARVAGVVFVDRADERSRLIAMRVMRRLLQRGATVLVFPEGTTFPGDEVRTFHPGAFFLPPQVEVLPVGLAYDEPSAEFGDETLATHAARVASRRHTRVAVAIGAPIVAPEVRRGAAHALAAAAQVAVQRLVYIARAAHA